MIDKQKYKTVSCWVDGKMLFFHRKLRANIVMPYHKGKAIAPDNITLVMDYIRRGNWLLKLELKMYRATGNAFQDFFADIMAQAYPVAYVRIRPYGRLGDKGCDGYRTDTGAVHQCYAPMQPSESVAVLVQKMRADFELAKRELSSIMRSWIFTHNFMGGLPANALLERESILRDHPESVINFFGKEAFEELIFSLPENKIEILLGQVPGNADYTNVDVSQIAAMLNAVAALPPNQDNGSIKPVPYGKIAFNGLSEHAKILITQGMLNEPLVGQYLNGSDPGFGDRVAATLTDHYKALRLQGFFPDQTYVRLQNFVFGEHRTTDPTSQEQVAAQAILSYFFHTCDIFEDNPQSMAS